MASDGAEKEIQTTPQEARGGIWGFLDKLKGKGQGKPEHTQVTISPKEREERERVVKEVLYKILANDNLLDNDNPNRDSHFERDFDHHGEPANIRVSRSRRVPQGMVALYSNVPETSERKILTMLDYRKTRPEGAYPEGYISGSRKRQYTDPFDNSKSPPERRPEEILEDDPLVLWEEYINEVKGLAEEANTHKPPT